MRFSLSKRLQSFTHAFRGAVTLVATQHNARIHLVATAVAAGAGWTFRITSMEWIAVIVAISGVWMAEALNSGIEFLADEVSLEKRDRIKMAKDVAAFGVLVASTTALVIGVIIFWPYFISSF